MWVFGFCFVLFFKFMFSFVSFGEFQGLLISGSSGELSDTNSKPELGCPKENDRRFLELTIFIKTVSLDS